MSRVFNILVNLLIVLLLAYLILGPRVIKWTGADAVFPPPIKLKEPLEVDLRMQLLHFPSKEINQFELKPDKIQIVNFWATYCRPCLAEFPAIQKLYDNEKDKIELYVVSLDRYPELVTKFMEKNDYTFPIYYNRTPGPLPGPLSGGGIPKTAVFYNGKMTHLHNGIANWNSRKLRRWIKAHEE
jgi:thiol-disulfide isomerase/thioredoxin